MPSSEYDYKPVKIFSSFDPQDILMAKLILDEEGILYETTNETFSGMMPGLDEMATVEILVDQADAKRAHKALEALEKKKHEK